MTRTARAFAREREARDTETYWREQERLYEAATTGVEGLFHGLYTTDGGPLYRDEQAKAKIMAFLDDPSPQTWAEVAFQEVQPTVPMWRLWRNAEPDKVALGRHPSQPWDSSPDPAIIREQMQLQGQISPKKRRRRVPRRFRM